MSLPQFIPRIFRQAHRRYGRPTMTVVRPVTAWSLPAGFTYDADLDVVSNSGGTVLRNVSDYWVSDLVYIVPVRHSMEDNASVFQKIMAGGLVETGVMDIWVLGETDIQRVLDCYRVRVGTRWFDVSSVQIAPSGYPDQPGLWARVTLTGR